MTFDLGLRRLHITSTDEYIAMEHCRLLCLGVTIGISPTNLEGTLINWFEALLASLTSYEAQTWYRYDTGVRPVLS